MAEENTGWAESIARSVARAWNIDWRENGLDGAAFEALVFCARRFDPTRGVPFKGYARRRIHEASTEAARKSKGWKTNNVSTTDDTARQISAELLQIFPEMRCGELYIGDDYDTNSSDGLRSAIRHLIVGASLLSSRYDESTSRTPEELLDYKRLIKILSALNAIHQAIMWMIYWEGQSLRAIADEWNIDELVIIREHKIILAHLTKVLTAGRALSPPRVRPGLVKISQRLKEDKAYGIFSKSYDSNNSS